MARKILTEADIQKRRRSVIFAVAGSCLGAVALSCVIALVVYLKLTGKPPAPPEAKVAAQAVTQSATQPAPTIDQQVEAVRRQSRPGAVQPVQLVATSQDLTATINRSLHGNDVQDLQVHLGDGTAAAQARVNMEGRSLWMTLRFNPRAENGKVRLDLVDARVGSMPMPDALRRKVQQEMDKQSLNEQFGAGGMWVDTISVSQGRLYIQGRVQGR